MKRLTGAFFILLAVALMVVPAPAFASLGEDCTYDGPVKWWDNPDSNFLYLQNWGRTPITAMSRLAGLAYPDILHGKCNQSGNCPSDRVTGCDVPTCENACACTGSNSEGCGIENEIMENCLGKEDVCCCCWGNSLAFSNKGWGSADIGTIARINNQHPNHMVGDWGVTACPHPECVADGWCLPDNLAP